MHSLTIDTGVIASEPGAIDDDALVAVSRDFAAVVQRLCLTRLQNAATVAGADGGADLLSAEQHHADESEQGGSATDERQNVGIVVFADGGAADVARMEVFDNDNRGTVRELVEEAERSKHERAFRLQKEFNLAFSKNSIKN